MWGVGDREKGEGKEKNSIIEKHTNIYEFCTYTCHKSFKSGEKSDLSLWGRGKKKKQGGERREGQKEEGGRREGKQVCFSNWLHHVHQALWMPHVFVLNFHKPHCASRGQRKWGLDMSKISLCLFN